MDPEDPDSDPDHYPNLIISFFYLFRHIRKISSKSVYKFLSYLVHKIHKLTNKLTNKPRRKHNLFGGGNKIFISERETFTCINLTTLFGVPGGIEAQVIHIVYIVCMGCCEKINFQFLPKR